MAKATYWTETDVEARKCGGANRIRYPGSPHRKRWILGVGRYKVFCAVANAVSIPPGGVRPQG